MSEHALRLAVVLPLLLLLLGGVLVAARRGLIRLPGAQLGEAPLRLVQVVALGPGTKLAVAQFDGRSLLIGVGKDGVRLLADGGLASLAPTPGAGSAVSPPPSLAGRGALLPSLFREGSGVGARAASPDHRA